MSLSSNESARLQKMSAREARQLQERLLETPQAAGVIDNDDQADETNE